MLFKKTKNQKNTRPTQRMPKEQFDSSFRRNNVVVSKRERALKEHQQSVTQRQQDRLKQQLRHTRKIRLLICLGIILSVLFVLKMRINELDLLTSKEYKLTKTEQVVYSNSIKDEISRHTLFSQSWLLDSEGLNRQIKKNHPEIEDIFVHPKSIFSSKTDIDIMFRNPIFVWKDVSGSNYFVDREGVLFKVNLADDINTKKLVHINDRSGVTLGNNTSVLTRPLIAFIGQLPDQVARVYGPKVTVEKVIIPQSIRELRFKANSQPYEVKLSTTRSIQTQMGELKTLLNFLKGRRTPASYIDLRVEGKAFYK